MIDPRDLATGPLTDADLIEADAKLLVEEIAAQEGVRDDWRILTAGERLFFIALARNPALLSRRR